jgi:polyamine oxidase
LDELSTFEDILEQLRVEAGEILTDNLQDRTVREGLGLVGWKPEKREYPMAAAAVEWFVWGMYIYPDSISEILTAKDGEQAYTPEESSLVFGAAVSNFTFLQYSDENNFIIDQRGHNTWIKGEASVFLKPDDPRLLLNTIVTDITYSDDGVTVTNEDGSCIQAEYAVCTFSIGVLQEDVVTFEPALPEWKRTAIEMFQIGTYTKIFMQFDENFWGNETQFFLYADPIQRGWYPIFQSLDTEGFFPGSGILFVTVVNRESYRVERQSDEATQAEVMEVLRKMVSFWSSPFPYCNFSRTQ